MNLNLNQKQMELTLKSMGVIVSINNYDDMIKTVKKTAVNDYLEAIVTDITNSPEKRLEIFGYFNPPITMFENVIYISEVKDEYFLNLLNGRLSRYFEEKENKVSKVTMRNAYKIQLLEQLKTRVVNENAASLFSICLFYLNRVGFFKLVSTGRYMTWTKFDINKASYINAKAVTEINLTGTEMCQIETEMFNHLEEIRNLSKLGRTLENGRINLYSELRFHDNTFTPLDDIIENRF